MKRNSRSCCSTLCSAALVILLAAAWLDVAESLPQFQKVIPNGAQQRLCETHFSTGRLRAHVPQQLPQTSQQTLRRRCRTRRAHVHPHATIYSPVLPPQGIVFPARLSLEARMFQAATVARGFAQVRAIREQARHYM